MFRPLTPALGVAAFVVLTACSDNPLGPRSTLELEVPGGTIAGTGNPPADPATQNSDTGSTGAPATDDSFDPRADSPDDPQTDGDEPSDEGQGGDDAGSDSASSDSSNQDSGNQDNGNQDAGNQGAGNQVSGNQDAGGQDSDNQDSSNSGDPDSSDTDSSDPDSSDPDSSDPDSSNQDSSDQDSSDQDSSSQDSSDSNSGSSGSTNPPGGGSSGQQGGNPNGGNPNGGNPNGSNPVSSPVSLGGSVQVEVPGGEIIAYRSSPQPAAAGGFCGNGNNGYPLGTWVKPAGPIASVHTNHTHCVVRSEATTITVSFAIAGTYVVTPAGNLLLNVDPDRHIHYIAQQNATSGQGVLLGQGSDGSVWELDLSQVQHAGHTRPAVPDGINPLHRRYTALTAVRQGAAALTAQVTLAW